MTTLLTVAVRKLRFLWAAAPFDFGDEFGRADANPPRNDIPPHNCALKERHFAYTVKTSEEEPP